MLVANPPAEEANEASFTASERVNAVHLRIARILSGLLVQLSVAEEIVQFLNCFTRLCVSDFTTSQWRS